MKNNWLERKTSPDGYKFSWWFLALSRFSPFTFSLMAWQETKKIILINSRLFTMDLFSTKAPTSRRIPTNLKTMNSECPLQKLKWNSLCSFQWRTGKGRRIFVILLSKRCYPIYVNVFRFCTSNFFTDDGCEHAKMKQFTLVAGNIRSQCTLFWKNHWIVNPKIQSRLVTVLNWSFCLETVSYLGVMTIYSWAVHFPVTAICVIENKVGK